MTTNELSILNDPLRLQAIRELELLDAPAEACFDRLTRLAAKLLQTPVAMISIISDEKQFTKSASIIQEIPFEQRSVPLTYSYCKHVVLSGEPLVIQNAREDETWCDHPAIEAYQIIAYLGIPLITQGGMRLGTLCAVHHEPRNWSADDLEVMLELAQSVITEIELRAALRAEKAHQAMLQHYTQELEDRNRDLDAYSYAVAHDLKNPLGNIMAYASLVSLTATEMQPRTAQLVSRIERAAERMEQVINQLLQLATRRDISSSLVMIDMQAIATSALDCFEEQFATNGIQAQIEGALPDAIGHPVWVEQVFNNLINNAIKYRDHRQPAPGITIRARQSAGAWRYEVCDNGIGISPENQARLFEMFSRVEEGYAEGFGIGLALVHRMVIKMGGQVGVESDKGKGSTFWFTLPASSER